MHNLPIYKPDPQQPAHHSKVFLLSFIFFASLLFSLPGNLKATHIAGGDIVYEYIGDSTGTPYEYCIYLTLYRLETAPAALPATQPLNISSSCFADTTVTVTRFYLPGDSLAPDGGVYIPDAEACIDPSDPDFGPSVITMHRYKICNIVLPGECADFSFWWRDCCRNDNITNLANPSSHYIYLEATLNNIFGPNTSPNFLNPAAKFFCDQQPFTWSQSATEPDLDSIKYTLGHPWDDKNVTIDYNTAINPQWNPTYPMTTTSGSFGFNSATGVMRFTPSGAQVVVIKIVVEEWRWDSVNNTYYRVGTSIRELQIPVLSNCNPIATSGVSISQGYSSGGVTSTRQDLNTDSLAAFFGVDNIVGSSHNGPQVSIDIVGYNCYDSIINIKVDGDLKCSTIKSDGSDFRLVGPDGETRPVVGVEKNCQTTLLTSDFNLKLHKPLDVDGDYLLQVRYGNDSTTIENECGFGVKNFFSLIIRVKNCPELAYQLENVTVISDSTIGLSWSVVDTTYNPRLFNNWKIWRAHGDQRFYNIGQLADHTARSYVDSVIGPYEVDNSVYRYAVQLIQNSDHYREWTNHVHSILLTDTLKADSSGFRLHWTTYNGWPAPTYQVYLAKFDTDINSMDWASYDGPDSNFYETEYLYPDPLTTEDIGLYAFKVEAMDGLNSSNTNVSESNWVVFELIEDPENPALTADLEIPNIFTPNGDNANPAFVIKPGSEYGGKNDEIHISIYNRWGKQVHEYVKPPGTSYTSADGWNGEDSATGVRVSDGVYYYVIRLTDHEDNKMEEIKGHITVIGGTN